MPNQVTGRIMSISNVETIPSKTGGNPFQKRTLVLNCSRSVYGETYENYPSFVFTGKHLNDVQNFTVGDIVDVSFVIQGKKSHAEGQQVRYFNTVAGYKIELHQRQQTNTQSQNATQEAIPTAQDPLPF